MRLAVAGKTLPGQALGGGCRLQGSKLLLHAVLEPPLPESSLVQVQPVLLGTNDHTRAHETHESDDLVGGETMPVDEVGSNQAASPSKTSLAVHGDALLADSDHLVGEVDEVADEVEGWTRAIVENHVQVLDAKGGEVGRRVKLGVEADHETNVAGGEMGKDILEWRRDLSLLQLCHCLRNGRVDRR